MLCEALQDVAEGRLQRLMVLMPPGSAKSTYATVRFPAWFLGREGGKRVVCASYNDELATEFGRRARNLIRQEEFSRVFGEGLSDDAQASGAFALRNESEYFSVGVGGGVTGRRADLIIADDLIRGRLDAESETVRRKTWQWWNADLMTRGKPGFSLVLINTRWHEDDVSGRILPKNYDGGSGWYESKQGERWFVLCLPAEARAGDALGREPGEMLWPDYFTPEHWKSLRAMMPPREWRSLYQQQPTADEGTQFKKRYFEQRWTTRPKSMNIYIFGDFAVTPDAGDFTEFGVFGIDETDRVIVLDWWHGQTSSDVWIEVLLDLCARWKPIRFVGESGVIRRAIEPILQRRMMERREFVSVEWMASIADKGSRARSFEALAANLRVWFPETEWAERVIDQLLRFPAGTHDDAVDVCSLAGRYIDHMWQADKPKAPAPILEQVWNQPVTIASMRARRGKG
jgi:predicted phage terminase large subunit-like protein